MTSGGSGSGGKSTTERLISLLSARNAKRLAFVLVVGFIGYHGLLHLKYGSDSCTWLLSSGRYKGDHEWQPYGCMLHRYSQTDTRHCLRYLAFWGKANHFAFIGDSRLQQLHHYFVGLLQTHTSTESTNRMSNYTYQDTKLKLSVEFIYSPDVSHTMVDQFRTWQRATVPPSVIVAGAGLELVKNGSSEAALEEYRRNLTRLVQASDALAARGARVLWKLLEPLDGSHRLTSADIHLYNMAAYQILTHSAVRMWNSARLVVAGAPPQDGGPSLSRTALRHHAQLLLNMYCNDHMNFNDGSCCASPEPYTTLQLLTFAIFLVCIVLASAKAVWAWSRVVRRRRAGGYSPVPREPGGEAAAGEAGEAAGGGDTSPLTALARLGLVMGYFYLCDRTNFFMKENKYYSEWSFWLPVGYVFALGLFFTEDSRSTRILHREQTSEWKGWMQLVILVYHVTGASKKVLPIYMLVRALVSSYLFLTGYGHVCHLWHTGDTSLVRYLRVIFRLNFLTVVLCLTMNRPYQFYNFVPLVSFWYTMMWIVFALPPHVSAATATAAAATTSEPPPRSYRYLYLVLKIVGLLALVTVLYMSEVFFQKIFVTRPWKALFVDTDDDIHQWWLRWKQDRYSLTYGIIFGVGCLLAQRHGLLDDTNHGNLLPPGLALTATLAAFIGIGSYTTFTFLCGRASACSEIHSYVSLVPTVCYILLRNMSGALRSRHSSLFAGVGEMTLELFASQSHIWLAADTHGVLVLAPGAPVLNLVLTTYVFVCTAHELRALTAVLAPYAVPADTRLALRNLAIFLAVLVPIGIRDGMF